jgi:hypothetical protein
MVRASVELVIGNDWRVWTVTAHDVESMHHLAI